MCHGVGALNGRNDSLQAGEVFKRIHCLIVGYRNISRPALIVQEGVLRPDARVIQSGGNRINRGDLAVFILTEI